MEALGAAEDVFYEEEEEEEAANCYDFEPLPTLLEDEENVSLADILSLRDSCLTEQDIWAICLECCHSLKSIAHSAIFQTLCITPDTLAFNTNGNVCFMEQLSDDPEGAFVPPEFDITGNTFEAHIYSLGATLKAAIEYIVEPETESEFGQDLHTLLEQMQEENPENRPDIESILSLCEEKMKIASSSNICRSLSAVGRRVLSIESFGASQDVCDSMWKGRMCQRSLGSKLYSNEKSNIAGDSSAVEDVTTTCHNNSSIVTMVTGRESGLKEMQIDLDNEKTQHSQLASQTKKSKEEDKHAVYTDSFASVALDIKSCVIDLERDGIFKKGSLRKIKTFPKLPLEPADTNNFLTSVTNSGPLARKNHFLKQELLPLDNNNEVAFSKGNLNSFAISSPLETEPKNHQVDDRHLEAPCVCTQVSGLNLEEHMSLINGKKINFASSDHKEDCSGATCQMLTPAGIKGPNQLIAGAKMLDNYLALEDSSETFQGSNENYVPHFNKMDSVLTTKPSGNRHGSNLIRSPELSNGAMSANNNEDNLCGGRGSEIKSNEQWISLKLLLSWHGRPLKDYELWALCHECLCALQTCVDYPVVLCLDSVLIDCHGSILFSAPKGEESCDVFYLAPEIDEEDVDTEKVCIYGVAAVLWMAAKYSVPPGHKLVLPRKLKKLLLDMARKIPDERPSLAAAIKTCNHYLLEQGINSKNILILLSKSVFKAVDEEVLSQDHVAFELKNEKHEIETDSSESSLGFVPFTSESKLVAVKGPVPCQISLNCEKAKLPVAFTSPATHFKPIILQQDANITKEVHTPVSEQFKKEKRKENHMDHNNSGYAEDSERCDTEYADVVEKTPETPECDLQVPGHSFQLSAEEQKSGNTFTSSVTLPSPSDSSHILQGKSMLSEDPSSSLACPTSPNFLHINNIILKQDSERRVLTFVPVHLAVSEQIQNKPLRSRIAYDCYHSLPVLLSSTIASYKMSMQTEDASLGNVQSHETTNTQNEFDKSPVTQTNCQETECATNVDSIFTEQEHAPCTSVNKDNYNFFDDKVLPHQNRISDDLLQKVIHLIQEEFAFDGYLENGVEVFDMGNFILNLKEMKFGVFSDRICEKFCDLYWDEKLLENLYKVVNGERSSHLCITEASDANCGKIVQDLKKSESFLASSDQMKEKGEANLDVKAEPLINISLAEMDFDESPSDNIKKELRLQSTIPTEKEGQSLQSNSCCIGPDLAEENTEPEEEAMIKTAGNSYLASPSLPDFNGCSPGWSSAFYGAECFDSEVHSYLKNLGKQKSSESQNIDAKKVELEQLLMMETKNYRKTIKFYQKLLQKERRSKGSETKSMLPKLRGQLQEMKSKVQFLELVKKYVQMMYAEQWGVESCVLPTVIHNGKTDTMDMAPMDESSLLLYYNTEKHQCNNQNGVRVLQAGTPLGLMAYLYSRNAFLEGYVQQFLYTFRYFCTQEEFLQFLLDRISSTLSSASLDPSTSLTKICNRSFYILQAWIEDCYSVDFATNTGLLCTLKEFISSKVASLNGYGERLLSLLEDASARKSGSADQCSSMDKCEEEGEEGRKTLHSLCKKLSEDVSRKNFYWKLSKGVGPIAQHQRGQLHASSAVLPKPCSVTEAKVDAVGPYLLTEYSAQQLCWQLTLLQQEVFLKCHPVHFLNSRALGVKDKCVALQKAVSTETVSLKVCNLFLSKCIQDQYLLQLLRNADSISTWVAAEIVTCHTTKRQVSLLSKFLLIAKYCYEQRNFATAMQILAGLENLIVRQLPAWKILPAKVAEIMEELKAVEVFLKSDSLCLMEGDRFKTLPTIPSAHVLAMHVQQLETGGFTMTNGAHKWTKLRNIAKVVSQVHAFQENPYTYTPDFKLQSYLRRRITHFKDADISALAADNCANFHQIPAEKHARKIQDTLRRMKATFQ